jgi:hypothetical protein
VITGEKPSLLLLLVDALAFLVRRFGLFLVVALPISAVAAAIAWLLDTQRSFAQVRGHWGWDFLFVLTYAMFLDRWIKEVLLDGATDCDEVDNLRRSIVAPRFLVFAAALFVLAAALSILPITFPTDWLGRAGAVVGGVLPWLPHLVLWTLTFAFFALLLPSYAAVEPLSPRQALRLGRPVRSALVTLVLGAALLPARPCRDELGSPLFAQQAVGATRDGSGPPSDRLPVARLRGLRAGGAIPTARRLAAARARRSSLPRSCAGATQGLAPLKHTQVKQ